MGLAPVSSLVSDLHPGLVHTLGPAVCHAQMADPVKSPDLLHAGSILPHCTGQPHCGAGLHQTLLREESPREKLRYEQMAVHVDVNNCQESFLKGAKGKNGQKYKYFSKYNLKRMPERTPLHSRQFCLCHVLN